MNTYCTYHSFFPRARCSARAVTVISDTVIDLFSYLLTYFGVLSLFYVDFVHFVCFLYVLISVARCCRKQLVTSFEAKPFHFHSAQSAVNESKNRSANFLPGLPFVASFVHVFPHMIATEWAVVLSVSQPHRSGMLWQIVSVIRPVNSTVLDVS